MNKSGSYIITTQLFVILKTPSVHLLEKAKSKKKEYG